MIKDQGLIAIDPGNDGNVMIDMKKIIVILALALLMATGVSAKTMDAPDTLTASYVFKNIPLEVLESLRQSTRLDMLDYYEQADSLWKAPNAMEGYSQLQAVTPDYLKLIISPVSTLEIKILPSRKSDIAMIIYTVGSEDVNKDSSVDFFDAQMMPLRQKDFLKMPEMKDFFDLRNSGIDKKDLQEAMPFQTVEFTTGPGEAPLTATFTTLDHSPNEIQDKFRPILKAPLTMNWKGKYSLK